MYIVLARRRGIDVSKLQGTVQNDILKEYLARGNYIFPVESSIRLTIDLWKYCIEHLPRWNFVSVSGYHIREAGATAVQELAFTFADALCYVNAALERGLEIDDFAPRISFFFGSHNDLIKEVAKFRAARRIWARMMKEKYCAKNKKSWKLRFHTQTCGCTLTAQQPENNIVRVTLQALAAVLGGTQSLHTNSFDEAMSLPTEKSSTLALRTQQVIAHESGLTKIIDPLGGSYAVESKTEEVESGVMELLERIESKGGAVGCLKNGFMKSQIEESAYKQQKRMEEQDDIVVGVNAFLMEEKERIELLHVSEKLEAVRKKTLEAYRARRDDSKALAALERLKDAAGTDSNLMNPIVEAVDALATLGEISDILREVFGTYDG